MKPADTPAPLPKIEPSDRLGAVVPVLTGYAARFHERGAPVFASRDWHPPNHCSFREQGGVWPVHCVVGTKGSEFHPDFHLPPSAIVISKATDPKREAYSAFEGTTLDEHLRETGVRRLFIGGLATDYCVAYSALDGARLGLKVTVRLEACRAIDLGGSLEKMLGKMKDAGVKLV